MRSTARQLLLGLGVTFAACGRETDKAQPPPVTQPAPPAVTPPPPTTPPPAAGGTSVAGTVVETMDSGGYTYARLDDGGRQVWVAGPETKLAVGVKIGKVSGTLMPGFHSSTLQRTFEEIYFVDALPIAGGAGPDPHGAVAPAVAMEKLQPVAGGKTVAEVFASKDALAGREVAVRGKVVKVNNGILGRNWIHLQDGTGAAATNDLMVTTSATATRGDVVVVRGKVATNKDFGAGYKYDVIVEDATLASK